METQTKQIRVIKDIKGQPAYVTVNVPLNVKEGDPIRISKKDIVSIEFIKHEPGRLPRKEKKKMKKMMGLQGKSRAKIVKKTISKRTGDFSVRINKN